MDTSSVELLLVFSLDIFVYFNFHLLQNSQRLVPLPKRNTLQDTHSSLNKGKQHAYSFKQVVIACGISSVMIIARNTSN